MIAGAVIAMVAAFAALPSIASGAVTITSYKITSDLPGTTAAPSTAVPSNGPSTFLSGAHPDAGSYTSFSYPNGTEDLKTALTNFGAGLLGNPESVPKCP